MIIEKCVRILLQAGLRTGTAQLDGKKTSFSKNKTFKTFYFFEIYTIWDSFNANKYFFQNICCEVFV